MTSVPPETKYHLSRGTRIIVAICFIAILAMLILGVFAKTNREENSNNQQPALSVKPDSFQPTPEQWAGLKIEPVTQMIFHAKRTTDGKIAINDDATTPVFSPYSGRVTRLIARPGDQVKQGDPLFEIDATELAQAQNDLISADAALVTAKAQLKVAEETEKRQHALYESQGTALKTWQQSQSDLAAAREALRADDISYANARSHLRILGKSDNDIAAIENAPDAQKISALSVVNAPIDGTVIQRQISLGENIQAGAATPVYIVGNLSTVWLVANVREEDAPLMHVDAPVEVHVLAFPDRVFKAKLSYVAATIDPTTHRLPVRAEVENPDGVLKPEMFATFGITTGEDTQSLAVPDSAVIYEGDKAHVWVAHDDKTIALKSVEVGRIADGMVEVKSGLTDADKIVVSGALFIDRAAAGD